MSLRLLRTILSLELALLVLAIEDTRTFHTAPQTAVDLTAAWSLNNIHIECNGTQIELGSHVTCNCSLSEKPCLRVSPPMYYLFGWSSETVCEFAVSPLESCWITVTDPGMQCGVVFEQQIAFDWRWFALAVAGVVLFMLAPVLSRALAFRLLSGAALGVLLSVVLLLLFFGRRLRLKEFAVLAAGYTSACAFMVKYVLPSWENVYQHSYVVAYVTTFALIGAVAIYRHDFDQKDVNILSWALRAVGGVLVFRFTHRPLSIVILAAISLLSLPRVQNSLVGAVWSIKLRLLRPTRVALTSSQYTELCEKATLAGIQELRQHVSASSAWIQRVQPKTLGKMQRFLDGDSHFLVSPKFLVSNQAHLRTLPPREHEDSDLDEEEL